MKALKPVASARHYGSNNRKSMRQRKCGSFYMNLYIRFDIG